MMHFIQKTIKRGLDVLVSLFGLLLLCPAMLFIAVVIKTTSKGPVFFRQVRLGRYGRPFSILKFRTMVPDAEHMGDGIFVFGRADTRITPFGRFLRVYSLDELPQLINVLLGDMSLVGPRPPVAYHPYDGYGAYPAWARRRFAVRPGITGLAQVRMRASAPWNARLRVDTEYVDNYRLWLDVKILFQTLPKVISRTNVYPDSPQALRP